MRQLATRGAVSLRGGGARLTGPRATAPSPPHPTGGAPRPTARPPGSRGCGTWDRPRPKPPATHWARACAPPPRAPSGAPPGGGCCARATCRVKTPCRAAAPERPASHQPGVDALHSRPQAAAAAWRLRAEAGCQQAMARDAGRAPRGPRAHAPQPVQRGRHRTRHGAWGRQGMGAAVTVAGVAAGDGCWPWRPAALGPQLRPGPVRRRAHLTAHTGAGGAAASASPGARLRSLPPAAPDVSPSEACWAQVTARLRAKAARTLEHLEPAMAEARAALTAADARGWFTRAGYGSSFH